MPQLTDAAGDPKMDVFTRVYAVRILAKQSGKDEKTAKVLGGILAEKDRAPESAADGGDGPGQHGAGRRVRRADAGPDVGK